MKTAARMWIVAACLLPALAAAAVERGTGALLQVLLAGAGCLLFEALCLAWRRLPVKKTLADGSAVIAGIIIGLSLPPLAPWFVAVAAAGFAMVLGKHCYGGLGNNPFNPAMAGYALAFVSFPGDFGGWFFSDVPVSFIFQNTAVDAVSMPTPLTAVRLQIVSLRVEYLFPLAAAAGGAVLLLLKIADWRLPVAFMSGALVFSGGDVGQLTAGGLTMAAFFVITDPVTAAVTSGGRWLYGIMAGGVTVLLREYGVHADGIAFAILIGNMLAPLMDKIWQWCRQ